MAEIAAPMRPATQLPPLSVLGAWLRASAAARPVREPGARDCCFGQLGPKDAMIARGLAAPLLVGEARAQP